MPGIFRLLCVGLAAAIGAGASCLPVRAEEPFRLGVQTHFAQGWSLGLIDRMAALGVPTFRDELTWARSEGADGTLSFAGAENAAIDRALRRGIAPLVLFADRHPAHDGGGTPASDEAQAAFARYVAAAVRAHAPGLAEIEIGNEFNGGDFVRGAFARDPAGNLARLVGAVRRRLRDEGLRVRLVCSGTHSVAIGFLDRFLAAGGARDCDAISLHPYRDHPEGLELELARLGRVMEAHGGRLPIVATEFGKWFDDPGEAPDYMLRMVAILGAAGVDAAYWYALVDEPWWPNMGLLDADLAEKPAADAFRLAQRLLAFGRPRAAGTSARQRIYYFGASRRAAIAWGAGGRLSVSGATAFLDTRGRPVARPATLSDRPVVILGKDLRISVTGASPLADSRYDFGRAPWHYFSEGPDGRLRPLSWIDWQWSSFLGRPDLRPLAAYFDGVTAALFADGAHRVVERFVVPAGGRLRILGEWSSDDAGPEGDGAEVLVRLDGKVLARGRVAGQPFGLDRTVEVRAGQTLDFVVGPGRAPGGDAVRRRIRIQRAD